MDGLEVADVRVTSLLLDEIVHALLARRALTEVDVAGALLRTERRAAQARVLSGDISGSTSEMAELTTSDWDGALGLKPQLYLLRNAMQVWEERGSNGRMPIHAAEIVARHSDDE